MQNASLPLFYGRPRPLNSDQDGTLSLATTTTYGFAARTNSVPVNAVEFGVACKHYPIVFAGAEVPAPVVLLGFRSEENTYVDAAGAWTEGAYVPAYVRRYPFIFMESADHQDFTLCIDEAADAVVSGGDNPLFVNNEPSDLTKRALEFCQAFQGQHLFTVEFCRALDEAGLLIDRRADVTLADGEKLSLNGFRVIDEEKFNALPDDVFLAWRAKGWLHLVYCHLLSMSNWAGLIDRTVAQKEAS